MHLSAAPRSNIPRSASGRQLSEQQGIKARAGQRKQTVLLFLVVLGNALIIFMLYGAAPAVPGAATAPEASRQVAPAPEERAAAVPQVAHALQHHFEAGHGLQGFVFFSGYRISAVEFVALGLSALALHRINQAERCRWLFRNGTSVQGTVRTQWPGEHHARLYETTLLRCDLEAPAPTGVGGDVVVVIAGEDVTVYSEEPDAGDPATRWRREGLRPPYNRTLTFCSPPIYGRIDTVRLLEWLEFYIHTHGVEFFHMYDAGGLDADVLAVLEPYLRRGQMDVVDIRTALRYDVWVYAQVMVVNDCSLRTRRTSRWTLMLDMDEYLQVLHPPHSIVHFLGQLPNVSWLSFGSLSYSTDSCSAPPPGAPNPWAIERLVFREPSIHCRDPSKYPSRELCLKWDGHRKYVVNPRRIELLQIHRVMAPAEGGLDAHTALIRLNHYRGLGVRARPMCRYSLAPSDPPPKGFVRDASLAALAVAARRRAR